MVLDIRYNLRKLLGHILQSSCENEHLVIVSVDLHAHAIILELKFCRFAAALERFLNGINLEREHHFYRNTDLHLYIV